MTNETTSLRADSGLHEVGLLVVELEQLVLELAQLEEVVLLLQQLERACEWIAQTFRPSNGPVPSTISDSVLELLAADAVVAPRTRPA